MNQKIHNLVSRLWRLCNILRESGISYPEYVTELTYLLFLKMAEETGAEKTLKPRYRWKNISSKSGQEQFDFYKKLLRGLSKGSEGVAAEIFHGAETALREARYLNVLVEEFEKTNWYSAREESAFADLYEGLLEKNSNESKSGAGQYFTPRPLIDVIVSLMNPKAGEIIQDPACGTAGFLIAADRHIKFSSLLNAKQIAFQREKAYYGVEIVAKTHRLAVMNSTLHDIHSTILEGDALGPIGSSLPSADLILTNPPFGTKAGAGLPTRQLPFPTSNKQLAFLQHIYLGLSLQGRAAVILPDLQGGLASKVLSDLMDQCNLHTVLRLPTGIFYAPGIKTNVLFFQKKVGGTTSSGRIAIYDLRSEMPNFGKRIKLTRAYFKEFEKGFLKTRTAKKNSFGKQSRWKFISRKQLEENQGRFDFQEKNNIAHTHREDLPSPFDLENSILSRLQNAVRELSRLKLPEPNE